MQISRFEKLIGSSIVKVGISATIGSLDSV